MSNYDFDSLIWNRKPLKEQLLYLKTYYPIGLEIEFINKIVNISMSIDRNSKFIVNDYLIINVEDDMINNVEQIYNINVIDIKNKEKHSLHCGFFKPTQKELRAKKLKRILK